MAALFGQPPRAVDAVRQRQPAGRSIRASPGPLGCKRAARPRGRGGWRPQDQPPRWFAASASAAPPPSGRPRATGPNGPPFFSAGHAGDLLIGTTVREGGHATPKGEGVQGLVRASTAAASYLPPKKPVPWTRARPGTRRSADAIERRRTIPSSPGTPRRSRRRGLPEPQRLTPGERWRCAGLLHGSGWSRFRQQPRRGPRWPGSTTSGDYREPPAGGDSARPPADTRAPADNAGGVRADGRLAAMVRDNIEALRRIPAG